MGATPGPPKIDASVCDINFDSLWTNLIGKANQVLRFSRSLAVAQSAQMGQTETVLFTFVPTDLGLLCLYNHTNAEHLFLVLF